MALSARRSPRARLYSLVPRSSQCPSMVAVASASFISHSAFFLKIACASASRTALSNSKNISSDKNMFRAAAIRSASSWRRCSSIACCRANSSCFAFSAAASSSASCVKEVSDRIVFFAHETVNRNPGITSTMAKCINNFFRISSSFSFVICLTIFCVLCQKILYYLLPIPRDQSGSVCSPLRASNRLWSVP